MPLTGPAANLGKDNTDGFQLAIDTVAKGAINGRRVQMIAQDDQAQAAVLLPKAQQLVEQERVSMLAGANFSSECAALATNSAQALIPTAGTGNCGAMSLRIDPKLKSPWFARLTQTGTGLWGPLADYAYATGSRKVAIISIETINESMDAFAAAFVKRGGQIVQEIYNPIGTNDFGPYLTKLDTSADSILLGETGIDGLRFMQTYSQYVPSDKKIRIFDSVGAASYGPNLAQLKGQAVGVIAEDHYGFNAVDNPENRTFTQAWNQKYPDRPISQDAAQGYATAEIILAAVQKVTGNVEDKQTFMNALLATRALPTVRGPVSLDDQHDIVQNTYIYTVVQDGNSYTQKLLKTYDQIGG
ncbi:MAG TPA: ABC transporter substrate-binding protein, partial [Chloroflexota bacterium]